MNHTKKRTRKMGAHPKGQLIMGGNAIKGAKRMNLAMFNTIKTQISSLLTRTLSGLEHRFPTELGDKQSFGDVDVLVQIESDFDREQLMIMISNHFGEVIENGTVLSVQYGEYQVDFILVESDIDFAKEYFSHSDMGNLLGHYAAHQGLKLGHLGLYRSQNIPNVGKKKHYVTKDWKTALAFLGFDEEQELPSQFKTGKEMLDFITTSHLYSNKDSVFDLSIMNSKSRQAIRKRQYQRMFFTDYIGYPEKALDESRSSRKLKAS